MVILKYIKLGVMKFVSHIDVLRNVQLVVRRGEIPIKYSEGFNPHQLLYFSPPTVLGIGSYAEYVCINTDMDCYEVMDRFNKNSIKDMQAIRAFNVNKDPKMQAKVVCAEYIVDTPFEGITIEAKKPYIATYLVKGEEETGNIGDKIYKVFDAEGKLGLWLASGNNNLRVDRVLGQINKDFNRDLVLPDVVKTTQFVDLGKGYMELDDALEKKLLGFN